MEGSGTHLRSTRKWGGKKKTLGLENDGYTNSGRFLDFLVKLRNEAILGLRDPQNRTRDHVSIPKGLNISSYGPFSSHLVRISSQIEPNLIRPTWEEPGYGFWLFFPWGNLDFEGSKKGSGNVIFG